MLGITAQAFAERCVEKALQRPRIPYVLGGRTDAGTDCSNLVRLVVRELGGKDIAAGSNSMWNSHVINKAFIHDGGTNHGGGYLVPGALLFMDYNDPVNKTSSGTPGKMDHVGVYVGNVAGLIAENGKQGNVIHASRSVGFVAVSTLQNAWTHVAWLKEQIDYSAQGGVVIKYPTPQTASDIAIPQPIAITALDPAQPGYALVTSNLRLRKSPSTTASVIAQMPIGAVIQLLGDPVNGWVKARWIGEKYPHEGYCSIDYLEIGGLAA